MAKAGGQWTYRQQLINCGKKNCGRCKRGPSHGPYWYAYQHVDGVMRSRYVGKTLRGERGTDEHPPRREWAEARAKRDDYATLGIARGATWREVQLAYRRAIYAVHPDRGGTHIEAVMVNAAYERLRGEYS